MRPGLVRFLDLPRVRVGVKVPNPNLNWATIMENGIPNWSYPLILEKLITFAVKYFLHMEM
jgi:hypothetical protein